MSQIIYPINHLPPVIDIGKQTEQGVRRIGFDMHEWLDDWPGMQFSVRPVRPGETECYIAATEQVGDVLYWLIGAVDTEKAGSGMLEVLGVTEDERKLSAMCRTSITNTNTVATGEIPEPDRPWVDQVILAGETAKADAKDARQAAQEASQAASDAGGYSANADAKAAAAANSEAAAVASAQSAANDAQEATKQASTATQAASQAAKDAGDAKTYAAAAESSAVRAGELKNVVINEAVKAESAAKAADTAYTNTKGEADSARAAASTAISKGNEAVNAAVNAANAALSAQNDAAVATAKASASAQDAARAMAAADQATASAGTAVESATAAQQAAKNAQNAVNSIPGTLPNPHKLTLTGGASAEYDGSKDVSVEIPDVYIVRVYYDEAYNKWSERTQAEIRAAVLADKVCILIEPAGAVYNYAGEREIPYGAGFTGGAPTFASPVYRDTDDKYKYNINQVLPDGSVFRSGVTEIRTPNRYKVKFTGAVDAEYNGSEEVTVNIPDAFIVTVGTDKKCSHTRQEIVGAAMAGKACLLVYSNGHSYMYSGNTTHDGVSSIPVFMKLFQMSSGDMYYEKVLVLDNRDTVYGSDKFSSGGGGSVDLTTDADGNAVAINNTPIADAQAREDIETLKNNGGGSGGTGLPATTEGDMFLVTDKTGTPVWAKRTDMPTVILPETELTLVNEGDTHGFFLTTPPPAYPEVGKTYVVTFNGQRFELQAEDDGDNMYFYCENNFAILFLQGESAAELGAYVGVETLAETCTLSIVEKPAAVGGGGTMLINMSADNGVDIEIDRGFSEIKAAIESGIMPVVAFWFTLQALEYVFYLHLDLVGFDGEGYCVQFSAFVKDMNSIVSVLIADDGYAEFNTIQLQ